MNPWTAQNNFWLTPGLIIYTGMTTKQRLVSHATKAIRWLALLIDMVGKSISKLVSLCAAIFLTFEIVLQAINDMYYRCAYTHAEAPELHEVLSN